MGKSETSPARTEVTAEPRVAVVIVAHNEAATIGAKVRNCLELDYPRDGLQIVIASDGSTDGTAAIARASAADGVTVVEFRCRRGKAAVISELVPRLACDLVVFADARQQIDRDALRSLAGRFSDPRVGAVSGELVLKPGAAGAASGAGVGFYWRYEKLIRRSESAVDSTIGVTGALYAIRSRLFEPIPDDTVLDDVLIPLRIVRRGYRVLFDDRARAFDRLPETASQELPRKIRTMAGNFQLFAREPWLLNPLRNRLWFQAISHKALRLVLPLLHAAAFAANLAILDVSPFYRWTLAAQALFYLVAIAGHVTHRRGVASRLASLPYVLCVLCWATVIGFLRFVRGRQPAAWEPTRLRDSPLPGAPRHRARYESFSEVK